MAEDSLAQRSAIGRRTRLMFCGITASLVTALAGSAVGVASARSVAPTCRGMAATIVGKGPTVEGTRGDDVVVARGARRISTHGGRDTICVVALRTHDAVYVTIDAGSGPDVIDTSAVPEGGESEIYTRKGADSVIGGPGIEWVETCDTVPPAAVLPRPPDSVSTAGGNDTVSICAKTTPDTVDLGDGDDTMLLRGLHGPYGHLTAGAGVNDLTFSEDLRDTDSWVLDLANRTSTLNGAQVFTWDSFAAFAFDVSPGTLTVRGSDGPDDISLFSVNAGGPTWTVDLDLASGDDRVTIEDKALGPSSRIDGGGGRDFVDAHSYSRLVVDLRAGTLTRKHGGAAKPLIGIEDVGAYAPYLRLKGDDRDNILFGTGCDVVVRAGGGSDVVTLGAYQGRRFDCPGAPHRAHGGAGDDTLAGRGNPDTLVGGTGYDTADGGDRDDRCEAERRVHCETR
jgi:D-alanyl-D-alanine carboxypeptidase